MIHTAVNLIFSSLDWMTMISKQMFKGKDSGINVLLSKCNPTPIGYLTLLSGPNIVMTKLCCPPITISL